MPLGAAQGDTQILLESLQKEQRPAGPEDGARASGLVTAGQKGCVASSPGPVVTCYSSTGHQRALLLGNSDHT